MLPRVAVVVAIALLALSCYLTFRARRRCTRVGLAVWVMVVLAVGVLAFVIGPALVFALSMLTGHG